MASPGPHIEISPEAARQSLMEISKVTPDPVNSTDQTLPKVPNGNVENGAETKYRSKLISISYTQPTPCPCGNNAS